MHSTDDKTTEKENKQIEQIAHRNRQSTITGLEQWIGVVEYVVNGELRGRAIFCTYAQHRGVLHRWDRLINFVHTYI